MSAREMSPEQLAAIRRSVGEQVACRSFDAPSGHADALTADRDEARSEERALLAQRDAIREAHRTQVAALTVRLEAAERERDEAQRVLCMIAPEHDVVPPRLESAGPTKAGRDAAGWIITSAVRVLFMEMETGPPEKRNRLTIGIQTHDGKGQRYNLTLAKDEWESVMETQRDAARRERDALVVERDAAEKRLEAAERERDEWREGEAATCRALDVIADHAAAKSGMDALRVSVLDMIDALASRSEKLAALVEALDAERAFVRTPRVAWSIATDSRLNSLEEATDAALRAARGETRPDRAGTAAVTTR